HPSGNVPPLSLFYLFFAVFTLGWVPLQRYYRPTSCQPREGGVVVRKPPPTPSLAREQLTPTEKQRSTDQSQRVGAHHVKRLLQERSAVRWQGG
ncbi:hypothetical protein T439DRAFT_376061, partial [Meredithblackwellia eburnea MCA 4105]